MLPPKFHSKKNWQNLNAGLIISETLRKQNHMNKEHSKQYQMKLADFERLMIADV